ncbi:MAG: DNA methyltransferase [Planctomycetota bacterium]
MTPAPNRRGPGDTGPGNRGGPKKRYAKKPGGKRRTPSRPGETTASRDEVADRVQRVLKGKPASRPAGSSGPGAGSGPGTGGARPAMGLMTTTLWEYPSQHYNDSLGRREQGSKHYAGATPSWVIWQLLERYTRRGDLVVDPMCGSGTTLDVAGDLGRKARGFDLQPQREAIELADARELPMDDQIADFAFVDPPYSTHIEYSGDPRCIGKLDASAASTSEHEPMGFEYYAAMEEVISELHRVLRPGRFMGLYVSDSFRKARGKKGSSHGTFMPIGFELFSIMRDYFEPVDIISVVRHNEKLARGNFHKAAETENFFLRGFNYLFIMRKPAKGGSR